MAPVPRSPNFYRALLALPVAVGTWLVASGRVADCLRLFVPDGTRTTGAVVSPTHFATSVLWLATVAPLLHAAWEIGREHTAARRLGYPMLVGLREVVRRAFGVTDAETERKRAADFARPPDDRPRVALAWGAAVALFVPVFFGGFFLAVVPETLTPLVVVWLAGAGLLFGIVAYSHRRAAPYLRDEPGGWDPFRRWRLLNPSRYDAAGRPFVRAQIAALVVLPIWWLGMGPLALSSG